MNPVIQRTHISDLYGSQGPWEVLVAEDCARYIRCVHQINTAINGRVETPFMLAGDFRRRRILVLHAHIPKAEVSGAYFETENNSLSQLWREIQKDPLLCQDLPMGSCHTHPGLSTTASCVDLSDFQALAGLYHLDGIKKYVRKTQL